MENSFNQFGDFKTKISQMEKELKKSLDGSVSKLNGIMEKFGEVKKVNRKINGKEAEIILCKDNSIRIIFKNEQDAELFFEGKK